MHLFTEMFRKDFSSLRPNKDKDAFIGPKEFVSHMMMTQTKDKLFHYWMT